MENNLTPHENKLICENRKKLILTGIDKVDSANLNQIILINQNNYLYILGKDLHVDKLDVSSGHIEITGQIDTIKYSDKKTNLLKRLFK